MNKLFKILIVSAVLFLTNSFAPLSAYAQESTNRIEATEDMPVELEFTENEDDAEVAVSSHVEMELGTQSVWNKEIPIIVKFKAPVSANYVSFSWDVPQSFEFTPLYSNYFSVNEGEVYTIKSKVLPESEGSYNVAVNITYWADTNYISSGSVDFTVGEDLVLEPTQAAYKTNMALKYGIYAVLGALGISSLLLLGKLLFARFKEWMKPPDLTSLS